ncbi:MAG: ZIP family metal transporter [Saprospiraceae bacterium]|nr:ZIP family metal transporter [Saprospiraceae bacterium]
MGFISYLVLFLIVLLGGGIGFYFNKPKPAHLSTLLSFSGAYLLGICVLHLMPEVFSSQVKGIGIWVLGGFLLQLVLEFLSKGVEHAHIHARAKAPLSFGFQILLGLFLHAFLEGLPLGLEHHHHHLGESDHASDFNMAFYLGILLHKLPAAFALVMVLLYSGFHKRMVMVCLVLFALASPLGGLLAESGLVKFFSRPGVVQIIFALVLGSFLHIATTILFEMDKSGHHEIPLKKLLAIFLGLALSIFIAL